METMEEEEEMAGINVNFVNVVKTGSRMPPKDVHKMVQALVVVVGAAIARSGITDVFVQMVNPQMVMNFCCLA